MKRTAYQWWALITPYWALLVLSGCYSWPQEGSGAMAHASLPWDGYQLAKDLPYELKAMRQRLAYAQQHLELLRLRGAAECVPERLHQAQQSLNVVHQEVAAGLYLDAQERQFVLDNQLHRLSVRLEQLQQQTGCGSLTLSNTDEFAALTASPEPSVAFNQALESWQALLRPEQFARNRSHLLPEFELRLQQLAHKLKVQPQWQLMVVGYADEQGQVADNLALGLRRAEQVVQYLRQQGIEPQRLQALTRGEAGGIGHDDARTADLASRRVEFRLSRVTDSSLPMAESPAPLLQRLPQSQWLSLSW
ncbi:MAG: OmpA family protein [Ferrimonas sp.]